MVKDTRPGDKVIKRHSDGFDINTVKKVKPDGTRVSKDSTGKLQKEKKPSKPLG